MGVENKKQKQKQQQTTFSRVGRLSKTKQNKNKIKPCRQDTQTKNTQTTTQQNKTQPCMQTVQHTRTKIPKISFAGRLSNKKKTKKHKLTKHAENYHKHTKLCRVG